MLKATPNSEQKRGSLTKSRSQLFFPALDNDKDTKKIPDTTSKKRAWDIFHIRIWTGSKNPLEPTLEPTLQASTTQKAHIPQKLPPDYWGQFVLLYPN